jgi:Ca2+-binding RTX toxin-like protein
LAGPISRPFPTTVSGCPPIVDSRLQGLPPRLKENQALAAANTLLGDDGIDTLSGSFGRDTLDGGTGADDMDGGFGSGTYIVDNTGDDAAEAAGGGTDLVLSSVTHILDTIENLTLTGTANSIRNATRSASGEPP